MISLLTPDEILSMPATARRVWAFYWQAAKVSPQPPTIRACARALKVSKNTVFRQRKWLIENGYMRHDRYLARAVRVIR